MTDLDEIISRLNRTPQVMAFELRRAMTQSTLVIEADARTMAPQDTRRMAGSINSRVEGAGLVLVGRVGPSVRYGGPVEFGRRVGARRPPVAALMGWVRRHWFAPMVGAQMVIPGMERGIRATNQRHAGQGVTERQIRRRAWALARAISIRGIRSQPYLRPAYFKNRAQIYSNFVSVGARVAVSITRGAG